MYTKKPARFQLRILLLVYIQSVEVFTLDHSFVFFSRLPPIQLVHPRGAEEGSTQASEATGEVVDALIGCQFEETQQGHDEAVRARIMQVMVGCLEGGAGMWLPDEVVWEVLQTCMANLDQMVRGRRGAEMLSPGITEVRRFYMTADCGCCGDCAGVMLYGCGCAE